METHEELDAVLADLGDLLAAAAHTPAGAVTPCTDFDFATLRQHVVGWMSAFTEGFSADDHQCGDAEAVVVVGDGSDQVCDLRARLAQVLPAAAEHPVRIGDAEMPGGMSLSMILWEYQVHGWDLARAAGMDWRPAESGVNESLRFAPTMLTPDYQGEGKTFAPAVDVANDAPAIDRLVAMSGRDPKWSA
ncbi:TIGR03086 family protein [Gordonia sp. TBRC 11910]|uniref:TIGR03086 family protein n=1 Tax=Gordonia asplenii TaxID=2725283 RepID=A0A848KWP1_9ACTN|nr:TIGR03086 family metal-binding protein [Gordonia asplenii]NMN99877.1 TIGR03086 family protein [Gordonia asplenii]